MPHKTGTAANTRPPLKSSVSLPASPMISIPATAPAAVEPITDSAAAAATKRFGVKLRITTSPAAPTDTLVTPTSTTSATLSSASLCPSTPTQPPRPVKTFSSLAAQSAGGTAPITPPLPTRPPSRSITETQSELQRRESSEQPATAPPPASPRTSVTADDPSPAPLSPAAPPPLPRSKPENRLPSRPAEPSMPASSTSLATTSAQGSVTQPCAIPPPSPSHGAKKLSIVPSQSPQQKPLQSPSASSRASVGQSPAPLSPARSASSSVTEALPPSQSPSAPSPPKPSPYASLSTLFASSSRVLVACELADTERSYVASLSILVNLFIEPFTKALGDRKPPLNADQVSILFSNLQLIYTLNENFLTSLTVLLSSWAMEKNESGHLIGDCLKSFVPYFKMYSQYCSHFDAAQKLLKELRQSNNSAFATIVNTAEKDPQCRGQTLSSLLIQPIQRVPRYKLLFEQLLKHTDASHPDHKKLGTMVTEISTVASHINEAIRKRENAETVMTIEERFMSSPNFLHHSRHFIRQGPIIKLGKGSQCKTDQWFLFSNLLASARSMMGKYMLKKRIAIDQSFAIGEPQKNDSHPTDHGVLITYGSSQCLNLFFNDSAERQLWCNDLEKCITAAASAIQTADTSTGASNDESKEPVPTVSVTMTDKQCSVCSVSFSIFNRKHTCKACQRPVCADCSRSRLILKPNINTSGDSGSSEKGQRPERCCDTCALHPEHSLSIFASHAPAPLSSPSHSSRATSSRHNYSPSNSFIDVIAVNSHSSNSVDSPKHSASHTTTYSVWQWDTARVVRWLNEPEVNFSQYSEAFQSSKVTGATLLALTDKQLREMKIGEMLHRKRLLAMVEKLSQSAAVTSADSLSPITIDRRHSNPQPSAAAGTRTEAPDQSARKLPSDLSNDIEHQEQARQMAHKRSQTAVANSQDSQPARAPAMPSRAAPSLPSRQRSTNSAPPPSSNQSHSTLGASRTSKSGNGSSAGRVPSASTAGAPVIIASSPSADSHTCSRCQNSNAAKFKFCSHCGAKLVTATNVA